MRAESFLDERTIEDICEDVCPKGHYCTLKQLILLNKPKMQVRMATQYKCIEKFKFERSKKAELDIGWEEAIKEWVQEGFARKFDEFYEEYHAENTNIDGLYAKIMDRI